MWAESAGAERDNTLKKQMTLIADLIRGKHSQLSIKVPLRLEGRVALCDPYFDQLLKFSGLLKHLLGLRLRHNF